jgi:hypothetical protein
MQKRWLRAPSPALVISLIALFVALGGTTYAATSLPKNSVGTKQLKNSAVTAPKIKNDTVTAKKINTNGLTVPNAVHATTANSATNATNATNADSATNATNATNALHASTADTAANAADLGGQPPFAYATTTQVPLALGFVNSDGTLGQSWGVTSSSWDSTNKRYVIALSNTSQFGGFDYRYYAVSVAPAGAPIAWEYDSVSGNLLVQFTGGAQSAFSFTVYHIP